MPSTWYIARNNKEHGPLSETEFQEVVKRGELLPGDYVWHDGLSDWLPAKEVLAKSHQAAEAKAVPPTVRTAESGNTTQATPAKSWVTGPRVLLAVVALLFALVAWLEPHSIPYRVGAGLNGAVFGAIGGAIGGVLSFLVERFFARAIPRNWKIGAVSAGFLLGAFFGKLSEVGVEVGVGPVRDAAYEQLVRPKIDRAFVHRTLRDAGDAGRLYRRLEEKEPATFDAIVQVLTTNLRSGATQDQVMALIREQFIERISKPRMGYLADDDVLEMFRLTVAMAAALAQTNPRACIAMVQGKLFGDLRPYLSIEIARKEQALMERMLDTAPRPIALLSSGQLQAINKKVFVDLYATHGDAIAILDPAKQTAGQEKAGCLMFADYMNGILKLPRHEALALFRAMLLDPSRLG